MSKTLEEYIELYNRKADEPFKPGKGFELFFNPEYGFCEIARTDKMITARQMCGDIKFWRKALEEVAKVSRVDVIGTYCIRHIKPYIRAAGFKIKSTAQLPNGYEQYFCVDEKTGQQALCTPGFKDAKGNIAYYVTWQLRG